MKKTTGVMIALSMMVLFTLAACSFAAMTIDDTVTKQEAETVAGNANEPLQIALVQLTEQGDMTEQERQELENFIETVGAGKDPVRQAVDKGLLTKAQAQALGKILGAKTDGEDAVEPELAIPKTEASDAENMGHLSASLSVQQANEIEEKLVADVGYSAAVGGYPVVDTGQTNNYSSSGKTGTQSPGDAWYGQDATYTGNVPSYTDNEDGTVTDNVTGLMWQQDPGDKMTWAKAVEGLEDFSLAGYDDWRLPTIKELYSLIQFTGKTAQEASRSTPYIDTDYFVFTYGDATAERMIDSQYATSTIYESDTMSNGNTTMFGVNFADGRIKGYPIASKTFYVMYVRGNTHYGINRFVDNGDGIITDEATGLMWMQYDSGYFGVGDEDGGMTWAEALNWAETLEYAGYDDWTLPDAKQLQSIVDYTRSPDTTGSAAIDPIFQTTVITDITGNQNYAWYWTGTTHLDGRPEGSNAVYVAFGEAFGQMNGQISDVHGAGAQRSDPKDGDAQDYPETTNAPQGDVRRVYNMVRLVRKTD